MTQKSDPPDYSVTGEFSPGALVIGGEPFDVGLDESYPTAPPDHPGASPWDTVVRRGLKLMKNVLCAASACQGLAYALRRQKRMISDYSVTDKHHEEKCVHDP